MTQLADLDETFEDDSDEDDDDEDDDDEFDEFLNSSDLQAQFGVFLSAADSAGTFAALADSEQDAPVNQTPGACSSPIYEHVSVVDSAVQSAAATPRRCPLDFGPYREPGQMHDSSHAPSSDDWADEHCSA